MGIPANDRIQPGPRGAPRRSARSSPERPVAVAGRTCPGRRTAAVCARATSREGAWARGVTCSRHQGAHQSRLRSRWKRTHLEGLDRTPPSGWHRESDQGSRSRSAADLVTQRFMQGSAPSALLRTCGRPTRQFGAPPAAPRGPVWQEPLVGMNRWFHKRF